LQSNLGDRLFNAASVRYDSNSQFGGEATFRVAPAYLIPETGSKLKGSVGTGFRAPILDVSASIMGGSEDFAAAIVVEILAINAAAFAGLLVAALLMAATQGTLRARLGAPGTV